MIKLSQIEQKNIKFSEFHLSFMTSHRFQFRDWIRSTDNDKLCLKSTLFSAVSKLKWLSKHDDESWQIW